MNQLTHSQYIEQNLQLIQNQNRLSDNDLQNFAIQCKRTGLDPITRQIYAIPQGGKLTIMASIDGLRLIAERSGSYEGQTQAQWCGADGKWVDVWLEPTPPKAAKVGVFKKNFREATYGVALFNEYCGKNRDGSLTFMWNKMPALMIAKVAESLALRKAFPNEMSGIFSSEEMEQSGIIDAAKDVTEAKQRNEQAKAEIKEASKPQNIDASPADYVVKMGKHSGKQLKSIPHNDLETTIKNIKANIATMDKRLVKDALELASIAQAYLDSLPKTEVVEAEMIEEVFNI